MWSLNNWEPGAKSWRNLLEQILFANPHEYEDVKRVADGQLRDQPIRVATAIAAYIALCLYGYLTIATVWLVFIVVDEASRYYQSKRLASGADLTRFDFSFVAWNAAFGGTVWAALAITIWRFGTPVDMIIGFALNVGLLVHVSGFYTQNVRTLIFILTPSCLFFWVMPWLHLGTVFSVAEFLIVLAGVALLSFYLISATVFNVRMHKKLLTAVSIAESHSRAKSDFLANMSHEIRTPMNGILGVAELVKDGTLTDRQTMYIDMIQSSGEALLTIINDILDFSKIESGKLELDPTPFALMDAVEDVTTLLSTAANEKGVELLVRGDLHLPESIVGDVGRLRQVLTNLIGNAIKFTHEGHVYVDVSGTTHDATIALTISIADTGIGIAEDKLRHIFDAFTQAETNTTRNFGGTGLGLSISKKLIEAMGGQLRVESKLGQGSTFSVSLTLPVDQTASNSRMAPVPLEGVEILIVDDNQINRTILSEFLVNLSACPIEATSSAEGLQKLTQAAKSDNPIPLTIIDYHMPEMDGAGLARAIRANPDIAATQIIVLSSVHEREIAHLFTDLDIADMMSKPARLSLLATSIYNALNTQHRGELVEIGAKRIGGPGPHAARSRAGQSAHKVLVVDDNETNRFVLGEMLNTTDVAPSYAENGKIAYDMVCSEQFDIVLMDVSMPVMDGIEATKAIRAREAKLGLPRVPVIALTAHALAGHKEHFLDMEMDDYLAKPISVKAVLALIEKWLVKPDQKRDRSSAP